MRNVGPSPSIAYVAHGPNRPFDSFTINTDRRFGVGATRRF